MRSVLVGIGHSTSRDFRRSTITLDWETRTRELPLKDMLIDFER